MNSIQRMCLDSLRKLAERERKDVEHSNDCESLCVQASKQACQMYTARGSDCQVNLLRRDSAFDGRQHKKRRHRSQDRNDRYQCYEEAL